MEINEIKKVLYKEKPIAHCDVLTEKSVFYKCSTSIGEILFEIPIHESEGFGEEEPAQLLIRWIL